MEWLDVLGRIEAGESRTTEFKRGLGDLSAVGKAICAFANTEGGSSSWGSTTPGRAPGRLWASGRVPSGCRNG